MATMEEIARQLGISKSTVSKALSNATDVSQTTREAVQRTALELGYNRPVKAPPKKLAVLIENMLYDSPNDFGWAILKGFQQMTERDGYCVTVVPLTFREQLEIGYDAYMQAHGYLGALVLGFALNDPWLKEFQAAKTPTVLYDNQVRSNPNMAYLGVDNEEGMIHAVARLKSLGHERIGYLSGGLGSYINQLRYTSFFRALRKYNLPNSPRLAGHSFYTNECLEKHLPRLLREGVTAILCSHDLLAQSVLIHCQELGYQVPQDLSIVGFDDLPICSFTTPPLSSIRQDRLQLGRSAFYALESLMNGIPIGTLLLHANLVERKSIGPAPAGARCPNS